MQSAGLNNISKGDKATDSSGEEDSDDDEAGSNVEDKRSSFYGEENNK